LSIDNVNKSPDAAKLLKSGQLQLVVGDGRQGWEQFAPYDAIHVGAAAPEIPKAVSEVVLGSEMQNQGCSLTVAIQEC